MRITLVLLTLLAAKLSDGQPDSRTYGHQDIAEIFHEAKSRTESTPWPKLAFRRLVSTLGSMAREHLNGILGGSGRSRADQKYPYFGFMPIFQQTLVPGKKVEFEGRCFSKVTAEMPLAQVAEGSTQAN